MRMDSLLTEFIDIPSSGSLAAREAQQKWTASSERGYVPDDGNKCKRRVSWRETARPRRTLGQPSLLSQKWDRVRDSALWVTIRRWRDRERRRVQRMHTRERKTKMGPSPPSPLCGANTHRTSSPTVLLYPCLVLATHKSRLLFLPTRQSPPGILPFPGYPV